MWRELWRAAALACAMALVSGFTVAITPRTFLADLEPREKLAVMIPEAFGEWELDRSVIPVPPSPDLQKVLDETYDETLARTYRNRAGERVMLSMAYGRNQHKGMNTHRPEICYPAQGFKLVGEPASGRLEGPAGPLDVVRLVAAQGARNEPITYWLMVGHEITQFGYGQRAVAIRYGLKGVIPDGVLVRVSSISPDVPAAFELQSRFARAMLEALPSQRRVRVTGSQLLQSTP